MQGNPDTDRTRVESGWLVYCDHCGQRFESKRSDASFCCSNHRVQAKRAAQQLENWLAELPYVGGDYIDRCHRNSRSKKMYEAMLQFQKQIAQAVAQFEE